MDNLKRHAKLLVGGMLAAFAILSVSLAWQESATYDEQAHIPAAYTYVDRADMRLNPEHPPLLKDLVGFPLLFLPVTFPYDHPDWEKSGIHGQWSLGTAFLYESGNDADSILFWSRIPIILVSLLLGWFIYRWTKELAGTVAGLFATLLYVADPNIIAHSHYVTTDIGIAAALFFAFYFFVRFLKKPNWKNVILAGLFLGLAELTKFSAVLLFPIFGLFAALYALTLARGRADTGISAFGFKLRSLWRYLSRYAVVVLTAFALIWVVYYPNTAAMPGEKLVEVADIKLGQPNDYARFAHGLVSATSDSALLKPLSTYFLGVGMVFERVGGGNNYYFLGTVGSEATPWYFPIVFALKETLPLLALLSATCLYTIFRIGKALARPAAGSFRKLLAQSFQQHIAQYLMAFFVLFYAYISITGNLNIGFRHLFPILPFLYILIAKTAFDFIRRQDFHGERNSRIMLGIIAFWIAAIPALSYPSYLTYWNEIAGGPKTGYMIATDSNYDWGQDMKRLKKWIDTYNACVEGDWIAANNGEGCENPPENVPTLTPIDKIHVDYFGGAKPSYYLGDRYQGWYDQVPPEPGWYAISSFFYQESLYRDNPEGKQTYAWLAEYPLVARAGDSIFIFYVPSQEDGPGEETMRKLDVTPESSLPENQVILPNGQNLSGYIDERSAIINHTVPKDQVQ